MISNFLGELFEDVGNAVNNVLVKPPKLPYIAGVGVIDIQVDKPFYAPGEVVQGKVLMNIENNVQVLEGLEIKVKGKEKTSFMHRYTKR